MTVKLLGIETATEACSAAVLIGEEVVEHFEVAPRKHNELILPMCETVLAEAGVSLKQLDGMYGLAKKKIAQRPRAFTFMTVLYI